MVCGLGVGFELDVEDEVDACGTSWDGYEMRLDIEVGIGSEGKGGESEAMMVGGRRGMVK